MPRIQYNPYMTKEVAQDIDPTSLVNPFAAPVAGLVKSGSASMLRHIDDLRRKYPNFAKLYEYLNKAPEIVRATFADLEKLMPGTGGVLTRAPWVSETYEPVTKFADELPGYADLDVLIDNSFVSHPLRRSILPHEFGHAQEGLRSADDLLMFRRQNEALERMKNLYPEAAEDIMKHQGYAPDRLAEEAYTRLLNDRIYGERMYSGTNAERIFNTLPLSINHPSMEWFGLAD